MNNREGEAVDPKNVPLVAEMLQATFTVRRVLRVCMKEHRNTYNIEKIRSER